jgi:Cd2+/Zn2+-exporting ATPase
MTPEVVEVEVPIAPSWWEVHGHTLSTTVSGALIVLAWVLSRAAAGWANTASVMAFAAATASGGSLILRRALASVRAHVLDMNVLMTIAVIGAAAIGQWAEGAVVVFLFSLGGLLESRSLARTRRSIRDLMELSPPVARTSREGREREVLASGVLPGELISVRPGERIPLDGIVESGMSAVDESPITGESVPVNKSVQDVVYAGSLNTSGHLEVRVTSRAAESTLARIVHLVEEAQGSRAPSQQLVDRFARYYTPAVVVLAAGIAVVPPLVGAALGASWGAFDVWLYRALVLLVISCPCALVISTPVSIVSAITRATRDGVLVKGGIHLETAARVKVVAFDKTGTLTSGRPEVTDVIPLDGADPSRVIALAGNLEAHNNHPLARAVVKAAGPQCDRARVTRYEDVLGGGVRGVVDGVSYAVGTLEFAAEDHRAQHDAGAVVRGLEEEGRTVLVLAEEGRAIGVIGVADQVRDEALDSIERLRAGGVEHCVMLTGDNERTAAAIAAQSGVSEYKARLLPHEKAEAVDDLRRVFGPVAMIGDGINDAPALAASDLGIAMGAAGSDVALETADVALMSDDLMQIPRFLALGRRTVSIIRQNVALSVTVKGAVLALAMAGVATLWMAVFADTGVSLLVIFNGMRLLTRKP